MVILPKHEIRAHILWKLHIKRVYGGKHTAIENVSKGIPAHLKGEYHNITKELIKEGYVLPKPTNYGLQVSLNPRKADEIIEIVTGFALKQKKFLG